MTLLSDSEGPDQTARMHRLIWALTVCIFPKTRFRKARPIFPEKNETNKQTKNVIVNKFMKTLR